MAVLTVTATERANVTGNSTNYGGSGCKHRVATTELAAADSSSTVTFFKIPSNARIVQSSSRVYNDDLATSGSPTLSLGLFAVNGNITSDDDALTSALSLSAASTAGLGSFVVTDHANAGKQAWQFVSGQTTDPGGELLVKGTVRGAATTATGTLTCEIVYELD